MSHCATLGGKMSDSKKSTKPVFDYASFEERLVSEVCGIMKKYGDNQDVYAFSVEYYPDFTTCIFVRANTYSHVKEMMAKDISGLDLNYFKMNEEEWNIIENMEDLSKELQEHYKAIENWASDDYEKEDTARKEHEKKIIETCEKAMLGVKSSKEYSLFSKLNLNVYLTSRITDEDRLAIYKKLNNDESVQEYKIFLFGEN